MAVAGECRGRADRRPGEARLARPYRRRRPASRRLVSLGPLSVPRLGRGVPLLTGFDAEIERALARAMGVEILLPEIAWHDQLAALAAGAADIAAGATAS